MSELSPLARERAAYRRSRARRSTLVALASEDAGLRMATFDSDFHAYRRDDGSPVPLVGDSLLGGG